MKHIIESPNPLFRLQSMLAVALCVLSSTLACAADGEIQFQGAVLPLLSNRCFRCHGPDAETRDAGLRLDVAEGALAELDSGERAIVPGHPEDSALVERIFSDDDYVRMPPVETGLKLSDEERRLLRSWIEQGARYDQHWSFVGPERPEMPTVSDTLSVRNAIDRFVIARLERDSLRPSPPADRHALARRVALGLTGLPPSPDRVRQFVADDRPNAYERFVDQLLASPAFGERWARVWLDLARYADSAGYAQDPPRTIWHYRDWVIAAINGNMPFDQFTVEQIAGDMLPEPTDDQLIATAFHRNTMTNSEGGTDDEEFRTAAIVDRVNTTMQVWMGLTMGCAQCHDHKYDPISQEDYFRFVAIVNNTEDADRGDEAPTLACFTRQQQRRREQLQREIDGLQQRIAAHPTTRDDVSLPTNTSIAASPEQQRLEELETELAEMKGTAIPIMRELGVDKRRRTHVHIRGNFLNPGREVTAALPSAFRADRDAAPNRLDLARWLVSHENPLTARVVVNRHWEQLFGVGLVDTSEDFGRQGDPPSHPRLLDYLAVELMDHGWDIKRLARQIVTSATYRQSAAASGEMLERDPQNRLLARGPRFRLSAEMIRDQALAVSGLLSDKMNGPSVRPPQPKLGMRAAFGGSTDWETSDGEDRLRRGLYTHWRRTTPYPSLITFDAPSREFCAIRRIRTNTPLQALVTLNDPVYVEAAQALARRIMMESSSAVPATRARYGFQLCLVRPPREQEIERLITFYRDAHGRYSSNPQDALAMATVPIGPAPTGLEVVELAAWTVVGNVLLNLDEFLTR